MSRTLGHVFHYHTMVHMQREKDTAWAITSLLNQHEWPNLEMIWWQLLPACEVVTAAETVTNPSLTAYFESVVTVVMASLMHWLFFTMFCGHTTTTMACHTACISTSDLTWQMANLPTDSIKSTHCYSHIVKGVHCEYICGAQVTWNSRHAFQWTWAYTKATASHIQSIAAWLIV